MNNGLFITFEGPDGSGKSTILKYFENFLEEKKISYISTKEPGSPKSDVCRIIRDLVLNPNYKVNPESELFMYMADRCQHVGEVILPALQEGKVVLCDRYIDSTYAYQGWGRRFGEKKDIENIKFLNEISTNGLLPDVTIILLVKPEIGLKRIQKRKDNKEFGESTDRIENEKIEFHQRVYNGYLETILTENNPKRKIISFDTSDNDEQQTWLFLRPKIEEILNAKDFKK